MDDLELHRYHVAHAGVRDRIAAGETAEARARATGRVEAARAALDQARGDAGRDRLASCLCDLAACHLAAGELAPAVRLIDEAMRAAPGSQHAFHSLASTLFQSGQLRGRNFAAIRGILERQEAVVPWAGRYRRLRCLPSFLNLQFVAGKCNLKCRMCVGTNAEGHPNRLTAIGVDDFRAMLEIAPTIEGLTLSSGDSDPLLHPDLERIVEVAAKRRVLLNIYTNGHPMGERLARCLVRSGTVSVVNFSIDAATPATYRRIRGADLDRLLVKIRRLVAIRDEQGVEWPLVAVSFVAMADNVHELPDFVALGADLGAARVFVGDLIGWLGEAHGNHPATEHPGCFRFVEEARRRAEAAGLMLSLPERLTHPLDDHDPGPQPSEPSTVISDPVEPTAGLAAAQGDRRLPCCGWINGTWVRGDGSLQPCCLVGDVADMGSVHEGPLLGNDKYARVKSLLMEGKVFDACVEQRMCEYVQQQRTAGIPLRRITEEDLGALAPKPRAQSLTVGGRALA